MKLDFKLKDHNIFIAGATKGVGFELAKLLATCGANLVITGREEEDGENAIKEIKKISKIDITFIKGDLYNKDVRQTVFNNLKEIFPNGINHLVSFLGSGKTEFGIEIGIEKWKEVFEINFFSTVDLVETFIPMLNIYNKNNSITLTSAIAGLERLSAPASYSCAKSALSAYVSHLAKHLSVNNIRVNGVNPGNILFKGGRWEEIIKEKGKEEISNDILSNVSFNRFGSSKELAWVYISLISPNNSFMTGSNIVIDGQQIRKIF